MSDHWLRLRWLRRNADPTPRRHPRSAAPHSARRDFRPMLESLEDRCVPASLVQSGNILYAYGDPAGNNNFQFSESTAIVNNRPLTTYNVLFDGQLQLYTNLQVTQILVLGAGSGNTGIVTINDTYMLPGASTPQQTPYSVVLDAGGGYLLNSTGGIFLQFNQFQKTTVFAGSADPSYLYTIAGSGDSILATSGNYSYVTGNGEFHMIVGATTLYGFSVNATDQAYQYDTTPGNDTFVASGNAYTSMSGSVNGQSFMNIAVAFPTNFGIATHSGDVATLMDSPGNDVFDGTASYSYLSGSANGNAYFNEVQGFSHVTAESFMGGTDFAYNFDPAINSLTGNWHVLVAS
jgi:hypothetical protein